MPVSENARENARGVENARGNAREMENAREKARGVVARYFEAFNRGDVAAMLAELTEDVAHHVNEGEVRVGKALFEAFCGHMSRCYRENLTEMVIFADDTGARAAAEYVVNGTYLATDEGLDEGLPEARGQGYVLPAGSFFTLKGGKIARVTTYYNLADWLAQVR